MTAALPDRPTVLRTGYTVGALLCQAAGLPVYNTSRFVFQATDAVPRTALYVSLFADPGHLAANLTTSRGSRSASRDAAARFIEPCQADHRSGAVETLSLWQTALPGRNGATFDAADAVKGEKQGKVEKK
jgi:hypothetical protein